MEVQRRETPSARWEVARRLPSAPLRRLLGRALEGWTWEGDEESSFQELPFPGIPLILNLGAGWSVAGNSSRAAEVDSFLAGLHTRPASVTGARSFTCLELRLTPVGARRLLGVSMHELVDRTLVLDDLLPKGDVLVGRLRDAVSWPERFDLVEAFLARRLDDVPPPPSEVEWAWGQLLRSGGRVPIRGLASELQWSPRRLIASFREHVGLAPKMAARVIRFDRASSAIRAGSAPLAQVAVSCGYSDQAHMTNDFRDLAGVTPSRLPGTIAA